MSGVSYEGRSFKDPLTFAFTSDTKLLADLAFSVSVFVAPV